MKRSISILATLTVVLLAAEAEAVIGRPFTPVSVAGVARRTTRRAVYAGAVAGTTVAATSYSARYVYTLPAGCVDYSASSGTYKHCGSTYYRPYYEGTELVYVESTP